MTTAQHRIEGPIGRDIRNDAERVLRSLPMWFGQEDSLREYVQSTLDLPTFIALDNEAIVGFVTVNQHFEFAWEIVCIAVHADSRGMGYGTVLVDRAIDWLLPRQARLLQVKTLSAASSSVEYASTRAFYLSYGFIALEAFPDLWTAAHPCLQLVKVLDPGHRSSQSAAVADRDKSK